MQYDDHTSTKAPYEAELTIREAARQLGVSTWTVRRWIRSGKLAASKRSGHYGEQYFIARSTLLQLTEPAPESELIARDAELARLQHCLTACLAGRGSFVLISGEVGIGKTALIKVLSDLAVSRGARVLMGQAYDQATSPPYGPWIEMLTAAGVEHVAGALSLLRGDRVEADITLSQHKLFSQVDDALQAFLSDAPLVLVVEDLHWADPASLELFRFVAQRCSSRPLMLVSSYRADEVDRAHPLYALLPSLIQETQTQQIRLSRWAREATEAYVATRYSLEASDRTRLSDYLQEHAQGNPLFTRELLATAMAEGLLRNTPSGWQVESLEGLHLPPLVQQLIDRRLQGLGQQERRILEIAAAIGSRVPFDLWSSLIDGAGESFTSTVAWATAHQLLEESSVANTYQFSHALVREALYAAIPLPRRRELHKHIGNGLAVTPRPDPDIVASHYQEADDPRATDWLIQAGERAIRGRAWIMAADRFEEALRSVDATPGTATERAWLLYRASRLLRHADQQRSLDLMEAATELSECSDDRLLKALCLTYLGLIHSFVGQTQRGLAEMRAGVERYGQLRTEDRLRADDVEAHPVQAAFSSLNPHQALLTQWLAHGGHFREALEVGNELVTELSAATKPGQEQMALAFAADAYYGMMVAYALLGDPEAAEQAHQKALEGYRYLDYGTLIGVVEQTSIRLMLFSYETDRPARRDETEQVIRTAQRRDLHVLGRSNPRYPLLDFLDSAWINARHHAHDRAGAGQRIPMLWRQDAMYTLGILARHQGDPDVAWAQVRRILPLGLETEPGAVGFWIVSNTPLLAAELALDEGNLDTAATWLATHDRWLEETGTVLGQVEHHLVVARLNEMRDDLCGARSEAELALTLAQRPRQPLGLLAAHRSMGRLDRLEHRHQEAHSHFQRALDLAEACRLPYERALTLLEWVKSHLLTGELDAAREKLDEARGILQALGAIPMMERAEELLQQLEQLVSPVGGYPDRLTQREVEVLRLVANGRSNRQIADELFISQRTIERHIANIYRKIDAHNRADATAYAIRHGLV